MDTTMLLSVLLIGSLTAILVIALISYNQFRKFKMLLEKQTEQLQEYKSKREDFSYSLKKISECATQESFGAETLLLSPKDFDACLQKIIVQSKNFNNLFAIALIELDQFEDIKNKLPTESTNYLTTQICLRLKKAIRGSDFGCHYSQGIFAVIFPSVPKPEIIVHAVERIIKMLSDPIEVFDRELSVNANIGIAIYPFDGETKDLLFTNAKMALEKAKLSGKNIFQFYQEETQALGKRELSIKNAIRSDHFFKDITLEYKPYFDATNNQVACVDVISSLKHPELGLISFDELLRISNYASKLYELYEWIIKETINRFELMKNANMIEPKRFIFSFNLQRFESPIFLEKITEIIKKISSNKIEIIIDIKDDGIENINLESFKEPIIKLNNSQIPIAIGVILLGHLALHKLNNFTFNYLRIDEKLVRDLSSRQESRLILEKIMLLASNLKIGTMTTGVDSAEKRLILENLGCIIMQGKVFDNLNNFKQLTKNLTL